MASIVDILAQNATIGQNLIRLNTKCILFILFGRGAMEITPATDFGQSCDRLAFRLLRSPKPRSCHPTTTNPFPILKRMCLGYSPTGAVGPVPSPTSSPGPGLRRVLNKKEPPSGGSFPSFTPCGSSRSPRRRGTYSCRRRCRSCRSSPLPRTSRLPPPTADHTQPGRQKTVWNVHTFSFLVLL